jgi:hypothetical protein
MSRFLTIVGVLSTMTLVARPVRADADGYIDNWKGTVQIAQKNNVNANWDSVDNAFTGQFLSETFEDRWTEYPFCDKANAVIRAKPGANPQLCDKVPEGELRAKLIGSHIIGFKFVIPKNRLVFDFTESPNPTTRITVSFEVIVEVSLSAKQDIDGAIDAQDPALTNTPLTLSPVKGHLTNAEVSSSLSLSDAQRDRIKKEVESTTLEISSPIDIGSTNSNLHKTARGQGSTLANQFPGTNSYFLFDAFIALKDVWKEQMGVPQDDRDRPLVFEFTKDGAPPSAPTSCSNSVGCNDSVGFWCTERSPDTFVLQRLLAPNRRLENPLWWPVSSDGSIPHFAFPFMSDINGGDESKETYRVCRSNKWGINCAAPVIVALPHTQCSFDSGIPKKCGSAGKPKCPTKG